MATLDRVLNFAFVMPVYDFLSLDSFEPALDSNDIGYKAFGWDIKKQKWKEICDFTEDENEAIKKAVDHHNACLSVIGIPKQSFKVFSMNYDTEQVVHDPYELE